MEKLRRSLKIFWTEHGTPILFWTIVIVAIMFIIQILNFFAVKKEEQKVNNNTEISTNISKAEKNKDKEIIRQFIGFCQKGDVEQAYNMLSDQCKKERYPTINEFKNQYIYKIFNTKKDTEINYQQGEIYEVIFYEDMLESGKTENRERIIDYYKIQQEVIDKKIYININRDIK